MDYTQLTADHTLRFSITALHCGSSVIAFTSRRSSEGLALKQRLYQCLDYGSYLPLQHVTICSPCYHVRVNNCPISNKPIIYASIDTFHIYVGSFFKTDESQILLLIFSVVY
jgi:hypothetical protein